MNPTRISKDDDAVVVEIMPDNNAYRIIYGLVFLIILLLGVALLVYAYQKVQSYRFWLDRRFVLALLVTLFTSFLFFRYWIWFSRGKEVVVIYPNEIKYYRDLYLMAEGKTSSSFQKIEVIYRKDEHSKKEIDESLVDESIMESQSVIVAFQLDDEEIISTNLPVSKTDAEKIVQLISERNRRID